MIVLDASVLATAVGDDAADGRAARDVMRAADVISAPDLVDVETVAVLRKRWIAGSLSLGRFEAAVDDLRDLAIERVSTRRLMRRAHELRDNVTPYDAAYVALAEALSCPLVTADERLARASGITCAVQVLRPG